MGTVEQTPNNSFVFAFGGKPNPNFIGLQDEKTRKLRNTMYRPLDPTCDGKNTKLRETGLPIQYKENGDIANFRREFWWHLQKHGM